jgi:hypothetical protein
MSRVPRVRTKLQCLLFRKQFAALSGELDTALATIQQAIAQVSAALPLSLFRARSRSRHWQSPGLLKSPGSHSSLR